MTKNEFISELHRGLGGVPQAEAEERIAFYAEMIDDRIEEGLTEEEAVAELGSVDAVLSDILSEIPLTKLVHEKMKPKRTLEAWEILLIILGFPLWFPLLAAAFAIVFSLFAVLWSLVVSVWAVEVSFIGSTFGLLVCGIFSAYGNTISAAALIGAAMVFAGLSVFLFVGCVSATKGMAKLSKALVLGIKKLFVKRG